MIRVMDPAGPRGPVRRPLALRCAAWLLCASAAGPLSAAPPSDPSPSAITPLPVLTDDLARQLRACLRTLRAAQQADVFGMTQVSIAKTCPTLAARLEAQPLPGARGRSLDGDDTITLRQLGDLMRLVEAAAEPRSSMGLPLSSARLALIVGSLDPAARGELSTRARLARWWRAVVGEFDPLRREQRKDSRRVVWPLGFWSTVSWVAFATAALLVVTVLVQEIRAALALRVRGRRSVVREARRSEPPPDLAAIDALPPRARAGALLRAVAARLHARGALVSPDPLTPREVDGRARLPEAEREGLRTVATVGEIGAYGRDEPPPEALAAARAAAVRWLVRGDALDRLRDWRRGGALGNGS